MRKIYYSIVMLLLLAADGCKNDGLKPSDFRSAIQFHVGDYWIYNYEAKGLLNDVIVASSVDSVWVRADTLIDGKKYFIVNSTALFTLNSIENYTIYTGVIDGHSTLQVFPTFSATQFYNSYYHYPNGQLLGLMRLTNEIIKVPAGTYQAVEYTVFTNEIVDGNKPSNPTYFNTKLAYYDRTWYADNVGMVKELLFYGNYQQTKRELIRYHIEK